MYLKLLRHTAVCNGSKRPLFWLVLGLMTKAEREKGSVKVASKGAVFGDGIYTANGAVNFR